MVGSNTVIVVPDNTNKRKDYEQQVVKTIFLSNADPKAAADLLRIALGARRVAPLPDVNGVTITDIAATVGISRRFVYKWAQRFLEQGVEGLADKPGRGCRRMAPKHALAEQHDMCA